MERIGEVGTDEDRDRMMRHVERGAAHGQETSGDSVQEPPEVHHDQVEEPGQSSGLNGGPAEEPRQSEDQEISEDVENKKMPLVPSIVFSLLQACSCFGGWLQNTSDIKT